MIPYPVTASRILAGNFTTDNRFSPETVLYIDSTQGLVDLSSAGHTLTPDPEVTVVDGLINIPNMAKILLPVVADFQFGTGDYTIESKLRINSGQGVLFSANSGTTGTSTTIFLRRTDLSNNARVFAYQKSTGFNSTIATPYQEFFTFTVVRENGLTSLFFDGVLAGSGALNETSGMHSPRIGHYYSSYYQGNFDIQTYQIIKGVALYPNESESPYTLKAYNSQDTEVYGGSWPQGGIPLSNSVVTDASFSLDPVDRFLDAPLTDVSYFNVESSTDALLKCSLPEPTTMASGSRVQIALNDIIAITHVPASFIYLPFDGAIEDVASNKTVVVHGAGELDAVVKQDGTHSFNNKTADSGNAISIANATDADLVLGNKFTIDLWYYQVAAGEFSFASLISKANTSSRTVHADSSFELGITTTGGQQLPTVNCFATTTGNFTFYAYTYTPLNEWVNLTLVRDNNRLALYINSSYSNERLDVSGNFVVNTAPLLVGATGQNDSAYRHSFKGYIDSVKIIKDYVKFSA